MINAASEDRFILPLFIKCYFRNHITESTSPKLGLLNLKLLRGLKKYFELFIRNRIIRVGKKTFTSIFVHFLDL